MRRACSLEKCCKTRIHMHLVATIGFDTTENEPSKVCRQKQSLKKTITRTPDLHLLQEVSDGDVVVAPEDQLRPLQQGLQRGEA